MLALIVIGSGLAVWFVLVLAHYNGWKEYDLENNTAYRFNEGICTDCLLFKVPKWLQGVFKKFE
jgi:hypothetical protein